MTCVKFPNAAIYKIYRGDDPKVYFGSTFNFDVRKKYHKRNCENPKELSYNSPIYKYIRCNGGWAKWNIEIIEIYPCSTKLSLEKRRLKITGAEKPSPPTTANKRRYIKYEEAFKQKQKMYYQKHKEKMKQKFNCMCGGRYSYASKSIHYKSKKHSRYLESRV